MDLYDDDGNVFMTQDNRGMEALYRMGLQTRGLEWPDSVLP
jgi:hypothetical protein